MSRRDRRHSSSPDGSGSDGEDIRWIPWFCNLKGNEFFCEVDEEFIKDDFNLTGLRNIVQHYDFALDLILNLDSDDLSDEQQDVVESAADFLYGLIHARYILTHKGMMQMHEKYQNIDFGRCPRVLCGGQPALPVGQTDQPRVNTLKIYCPKCEDIFYPRLRRHSNIDGAYFGTTFAHLLLQTFPELQPQSCTKKYTPRIYGFKIHSSAKQRMAEKAKQNRRRLQQTPGDSMVELEEPSQIKREQNEERNEVSLLSNNQISGSNASSSSSIAQI